MFNFEQIQLDFRAKIPLYVQLSEQLRLQIEHGMLQADEQLPPVRGLAERLRVNFNTVARAYRILDIEGWISTQQGRGTYITIQSWPRLPSSEIFQEDILQPVEPAAAGEMQAADEQMAEESLPGSVAQEPDSAEPDLAETSPSQPAEEEKNIADHQAAIEQLLAQAAAAGITLDEIRGYLDRQTPVPQIQVEPPSYQPTARMQSYHKDSRLRRLPKKRPEMTEAAGTSAEKIPPKQTARSARFVKRNPVI